MAAETSGKYKLPAAQASNLDKLGIANELRTKDEWNNVAGAAWTKAQDKAVNRGIVKAADIRSSTPDVLQNNTRGDKSFREAHEALQKIKEAIEQQARKEEQQRQAAGASGKRKLSPEEEDIEKSEEKVEQLRANAADHKEEFGGLKKLRGKINLDNRINSSVALWIIITLLFGQKDWQKHHPNAAKDLKNAIKDLEQAKDKLEQEKRQKFDAELTPLNEGQTPNAIVEPVNAGAEGQVGSARMEEADALQQLQREVEEKENVVREQVADVIDNKCSPEERNNIKNQMVQDRDVELSIGNSDVDKKVLEASSRPMPGH